MSDVLSEPPQKPREKDSLYLKSLQLWDFLKLVNVETNFNQFILQFVKELFSTVSVSVVAGLVQFHVSTK